MLDYQKKSKYKKYLYSKLSIALLLIISIPLLRASYSMYQKYTIGKESRDITRQEYNSLMERKNSISKEINRLKTDEGVEEEIREKFSVSKEGEEVIILLGSPIVPIIQEEESFFDSFKSLFSDSE
jgi:cell division protein FtsB